MSKRVKLAGSLLILAALACTCLGLPGGLDIAVDEDSAAPGEEAVSPSPAATNTPIPTDPPTDTPAPTHTPPAPTPGPLNLLDDFSVDYGLWDCDMCDISDGEMTMGPWPVAGANRQHIAYCVVCGMLTSYHMSVDVSFSEGQSDRGYGIMAKQTEDYVFIYEITPWQTVAFWKYDFQKQAWEFVNGEFSGAIHAGKATNHIEIDVAANSSDNVDISLIANGRTPLVIFNRPADAGWVGLTLFGHAMEVVFDNFEIQSDETPIFPEGFDPNLGSDPALVTYEDAAISN